MRSSCYCEEAGHDTTRKRCANCPKRAPTPDLQEHTFDEDRDDDALIVFDILNVYP